ncbi:MAG: hypothetical protein IJE65_04115 [Clostridia bacterium]|nr:hypothetical protein [Clostridia bacterium]
MNKGNKILVSVICLFVATVLMIALWIIISSIVPKTYSTAKIECEKILSKHQAEMEEISNDLLKSRTNEQGYFNDWFYICYPEDNFVKFELDGQGMLGGQHWDLVYTSDGIYYGETESYLFEEADGNNIKKAERLDEHWWYVWTDYDGTEKSYQ